MLLNNLMAYLNQILTILSKIIAIKYQSSLILVRQFEDTKNNINFTPTLSLNILSDF